MADIAMIGDYDSILLARAAGIDVYGIGEGDDAAKLIAKLAKSGTKVIFVTEPVYDKNQDIIGKYKTQAFPTIIPVPDKNGTNGVAMAAVRENVEKAIGMDIL